MKVGIHVFCIECGRPKAPRGRSVPDVMYGSLCTDDCNGFYKEPLPGDLWFGETEREFGYPCSKNATEERP